jgi:hypothetical protein
VKCSESARSKPNCEICGLANPTSPFGNFADCTFNFGGRTSVLFFSRSSSSSQLFSHFIIMASHSSKIRILCLHGWMQNADIMTRNMDPIIKRFEGPVEFGKNAIQYNTSFIRPCVYIFPYIVYSWLSVITTGPQELPSTIRGGRPSKF